MKQKLFNLFILFVPLSVFSGCTAKSNFTNVVASPSASPSVTSSSSVNATAAQIIFQTSAGGSFDPPLNSNGTVPSPGSGIQATRVFNPDGSLLASTTSAWPNWISSFEISTSGSQNTASPNAACANFANANESSTQNCILGTTASCNNTGSSSIGPLSECGASVGQYRVSEVDCDLGSPATVAGNGGPNDGVYFRAQFNRSNLSPSQNMLVTLTYAASAVNPAPANPTACFSNGQFSPENCSEYTWRAFLKHSSGEVVQPFLMLIPPQYVSVLGSTQAATGGGTSNVTKQFILPLAGDQNLSVLQVSRTGSNIIPSSVGTCGSGAYNLKYYCTANGNGSGNSPLCSGVIFYSLTLVLI